MVGASCEELQRQWNIGSCGDSVVCQVDCVLKSEVALLFLDVAGWTEFRQFNINVLPVHVNLDNLCAL